ncbi:hypothetical protein [Thalassolituus pacificus]|uniref:Uncharacterized protein n=1 Tax=Thalassolituus pacificus TaxID=2975440 RepID=A0A9X2WIV4_9GAMM|nr:hypothetical protein [Thalassolituus pacificus]MCT7360895.1 hypothetical protein [Thalassolituus pacificus]
MTVGICVDAGNSQVAATSLSEAIQDKCQPCGTALKNNSKGTEWLVCAGGHDIQLANTGAVKKKNAF